MDNPVNINNDDQLTKEIEGLRNKTSQANLPPPLQEKIDEQLQRLQRLSRYGSYGEEYERTTHYLDWIIKLPWNQKTEDNLDLERAKQVLDQHHYGMEQTKSKILEYLSIIKLNTVNGKISRAPILLLVGLVGTGKTTFGKAVAEAMGRVYVRVPFGGMGSALDLRGQSRLHLENEPGRIIKAICDAKVSNPVMLLDEVDRVTQQARADIMGVLVELLDPGQNNRFIDHYIDYPFDLSNVLFIATANNTRHIATAVLDRLEVLEMPSYSDEEKTMIGKQYLFPRLMTESGLKPEQLAISDTVWGKIIRPLGYDSGIRSLERTIRGIIFKVARMVVEGKIINLTIDENNITQFLPEY